MMAARYQIRPIARPGLERSAWIDVDEEIYIHLRRELMKPFLPNPGETLTSNFVSSIWQTEGRRINDEETNQNGTSMDR